MRNFNSCLLHGLMALSVTGVALITASSTTIAAELPNLTGSVVSTTNWPSENDKRPVGLYNLNSDGSISLDFVGPRAYDGGVDIDGIYYATTLQSVGSYYRLMQEAYDLQTGELLGVNEIRDQYDMAAMGGLATDPTTGITYGIGARGLNGVNWNLQFSKFDYRVAQGKVECEVTKIANLNGSWGALCVDSQGQFYAISYDLDANGSVISTSLYKINKETGATTLVGETGMRPYYNFADHLSAAVINPTDNKMYWSFMDPGYTSMLVEVDLSNGKATKLFNIDNNARFGTLFIPEIVPQNAPCPATDLAVTFNNGSLSGELTFNAPTKLVNGSAISGNLNYSVTSHNQEIAKGTTTAGAKVTVPVKVESPDYYTYVIRISNNEGQSQLARIQVFAGYGIPSTPNVLLEEQNGKLLLYWEPVTTTIDDGFINPETVTYNIYDKDENLIEKDYTSTSYTINLPSGQDIVDYYYYVEANNGGQLSAKGESNRLVNGYVDLPYLNTFDNASSLEGFIILDLNSDGQQWKQSNGEARVGYTPGMAKDDWLIAPPVKLEAGKAYRVSFIARGHALGYVETLEARWGTAPKPEGMPNVVMESFDVLENRKITHEGWMIPEKDGIYYFGIHCTSNTNDQYWVFVDDLLIEEGTSVKSPAEVTDLTVTPDQKGELQALIKFNAPTKDFTEISISSLTKIEVLRNGDLVKTFNAPQPGESLSFTDICPEGGIINYTVIPSNQYGSGKQASAEVFVGNDLPVCPENVLLMETDNEGEVILSWYPVKKDVNGLEIPASKIKYNVYEQKNGSWILKYQDLEETSVTFKAVGNGDQSFLMYAVEAVTPAGESEQTTSNYLVAGAPYTDFHESFTNAQLSYIWASGYDEKVGNSEGWTLMTDSSLPNISSMDNDNGYALFQGSTSGATSSLFSGKVLLEGYTNPAVTFCTYIFAPEGNTNDLNTITVLVKSRQETEFVPLKKFVVSEISNSTGWVSAWVSLEDYIGKEIQVMFRAETVNVLYTLLDNVNIQNVISADLAIPSISAPETVVKGGDYNIDVTIENVGFETLNDIDVILYAENEEVENKTISSIDPGMSKVVSFEMKMPIQATSAIAYYAEVEHSRDMQAGNNKSSVVTVTPKESLYPGVNSLEASRSGNEITLRWAAPELNGTVNEPYFESFEQATGFGIEVPGWVNIDRDEKPISGFTGIAMPNLIPTITTAPFVVINTLDESILGNTAFTAHTGYQYLGSIVPSDDSQVDDWIISPTLSGNNQTISFYAKSFNSYYAETIDVLWSSGSIKPENFQLVETISSIPNAWTKYEVNLPEGATRFAIRNNGVNGWMLMLDDFTYEALRDLSTLSLTGYEIYRDGVKCGDVNSNSTTFTDNILAEESHLYGVAARYSEGVSQFSFVNSDNAGVDSISVNARMIVEPGRILIFNAEGANVAVYGADGKAFFNEKVADSATIDLASGIYIVKIGNNSYKVIVR